MASRRPSQAETGTKGKAKAKSKPKPKRGTDKTEKTEGGDTKKGKKRDSVLEELDLKRRGLVMSGKWAQRIQTLNQEASAVLEVAEPFQETSELPG